MKTSLVMAAAVTAVTAQLSPAQNAPTTLPSSTASEIGGVAASAGTLQLRSLQAVLDARERRQDWHTAAQQAAERITEPGLRDQFNRRLAGIVPIVAKALVAQPQEDALVTVAVYRDMAKPQQQAMVAVTFDGLGGQIGQPFFADVIAGMPKAPEAQGIPKNLSLDTQATSYLVFFLGKDQLLAGDIPHATMGRSVVAMINKQRQDEQAAAGAVAARPNVASPARTAVPRQDPSHPELGNAPTYGGDGYINQNAYPMVNDGYYYPSGIGVPIVILPGENPSSADYLTRQRQRQMELERRYQNNNPYAVNPQTANSNVPQSPNAVTPQSGNSVTPRSGNYNTPQSGNAVTPQPNNRPSGPTQFPKAGEPGGAPANKNAPQQPAKGTIPPGQPGGAPAQPAKK